ncbi:hypothetical protein [Candidatus Enterococcus ferrettii]|uniref:Uncharacterized protein n=1 Tax=Candidatus Enterococcus ferrettii TaxID=2815324 RepID=A0ABV0EMF2_9ENTE|nr:hypothetical protein [Enterococcus sp. 665A]MBO1339756.1 hypothetical protein [Enterococcus sp. 665A]
MEKLMLATEDIFLDTTDTEQCMAFGCAKLVEYLRRRDFETGLVLLDESKTIDDSVQEALNLYIPVEEIFDKRTFPHNPKYFLDNSMERLEKASEKGFIPVLITEDSEEDLSFNCLAYPTVSDFHLSLIQAAFEK